MVFGDSLSAAHNIDSNTGWVTLLQQKVTEEGLDKVLVVNSSISGDTTLSGVNRLSHALDNYQPEWVILGLGANDALQGIPFSATEENIKNMLNMIHESGASVMLIVPPLPPNYGPIYQNRFIDIYSNLATEYNIDWVLFDLAPFLEEDGLIQSDGLHPTEQAQGIILNQMWPDIQKLISGQK